MDCGCQFKDKAILKSTSVNVLTFLNSFLTSSPKWTIKYDSPDHIKCFLVIFLFHHVWSGGSQIPLTILCVSELFSTESVEKMYSIISVKWFWNFERNTGTLECVEIAAFVGRIVWSYCLHNFVFISFCLQFYVNVIVSRFICCWTDGRYIASIIYKTYISYIKGCTTDNLWSMTFSPFLVKFGVYTSSESVDSLLCFFWLHSKQTIGCSKLIKKYQSKE